MYLFFDKNGTLLETITSTPIRQNNIGMNRFYVYIQDEDNPNSGKINSAITGLSHRYKKPDGTTIEGGIISRPSSTKYSPGVFEQRIVPELSKRDVKHFVYGRKYDFFIVDIPSFRNVDILDEDGEKINITENSALNLAGIVMSTLTIYYNRTNEDDDLSNNQELVLERVVFTVEDSGDIGTGALTGSQFAWLLSEMLKLKNLVLADDNLIVVKSLDELNNALVSANRGKAISYNGNLYLIIDNNGIEARKIFNLNNIRLIDIGYGEIDRVDANNYGIVWENVTAFGDDYSKEASALTRFLVPIVAGKHISFVGQGSTLKINADGVDDIKAIDTWNGKVSELYTDKNGITWTNGYAFLDESEEKTYGTGKIYNRVPVVEGNNVKFALTGDGKAVAINVTLPETTLNGTKVTNPSFYAPTSGGTANKDVLVSNGSEYAPSWRPLTLVRDGYTVRLNAGGATLGSFNLDFDKYIDKITYDKELKKITFTYADGTARAVVLNDLVCKAGSGLEKDENNTFSVKVKGDYIYLDSLYGVRVKEQEIADLAKAKVNGATVATKNVDIYAPTQSRVANSTQECYVLMPNGTSSAPVWGKLEIENKSESDGLRSVFKLNGVVFGEVKHTQEIYLDSVVRDGNKIVFSYNTASGKKQIEVDLADLVDVYEAGNGLKRDGNTFSVKIEPNSTDFLEVTKDGIVFKKSALPEAGDKIEMLEGATLNLASLPPEIGVITESGIHYFVPEVELELPDGRFVYLQSRNALPITAGEGVEFKKNPNNTVSINAKGGGSKIVTTTAELDKALKTEKKGTLISYVGESTSGGATSTPFVLGDELTHAYFDTNKMFDFTKLDYSNLDKYGYLNLLTITPADEAILRVNRVETSQLSGDPSKTGYIYIVEIGSSGDTNGRALYYHCDGDYTPQELGAPFENWGWVENTLPDGILELSTPVTITSVSQQDIWCSFLSATPFVEGGSGYKKDTLYMVTDNGAKEVGGETIKFKSEDKGKFLVVGDDGSIVAEAMTIGESMMV